MNTYYIINNKCEYYRKPLERFDRDLQGTRIIIISNIISFLYLFIFYGLLFSYFERILRKLFFPIIHSEFESIRTGELMCMHVSDVDIYVYNDSTKTCANVYLYIILR